MRVGTIYFFPFLRQVVYTRRKCLGRLFVVCRVRVEYSSVFHSAGAPYESSFDLGDEESTVTGLLLRLSREYGDRMRDLLFEKGKGCIVPGLMVLVNDRTYTGVALNQTEVPLSEGDRVSLLYFVSGG